MSFPRSCPVPLSVVLLVSLALLSPTSVSAAGLVPVGNLVAVGAVAAGEPLQVRAAMDGDGRFLVAWPRDGRLVARRFAADGTPSGDELVVFDRRGFGGAGNDLGDLAMAAAGSWAAVWIGSGPLDQPVVMMRRFAADGSRLDTRRVDVEPPPQRFSSRFVVAPPAVAVADDGLLVAWIEEVTQDDLGPFRRLLVRRYDAAGLPREEPVVLDAAPFLERPDVALLPDGVAAVTAVRASSDPLATTAPLYLLAADGTPAPVDPPLTAPHPGQVDPRLAAADGAVLHAYGDDGGQGPDGADGSCTGVFATVHRADGAVLADERRLNPFTTGCQYGPRAVPLHPLLGWAVTWADGGADPFFGSDDSRYGVYLSVVPADGTVDEPPLRLLPGWVAHHELAAGGGDRAVAAAVLPARPGVPARVVARRLTSAGAGCDAATAGDHLCLRGGRFRVDVDHRDPYRADLPTGLATARPVSGDTGALWFFRPDNLELMVKVLDGSPVNEHLWVFYGALSTVEYWLDVTDLDRGRQSSYHNPPRTQASRGDTTAFRVASAMSDSSGTFPAPAVGRRPAAAGAPAVDCGLDPTLLCLGQFGVRVSWHDPRSGARGEGRAEPLTTDTGAFSFFREANLELMVKILDGGPVNGHHWVFYGSLTDVGYTLQVSDFLHDRSRTYTNAPFELRSGADTTAFPVLPAP